MLLALQSAIVALLESSFPTLFVGAGAVGIAFGNGTWLFDPSSMDPVAGEPGPQDAQDALPFDPAAPNGPFTLTRPPYPGPKRVYLSTPTGDLAAVSNAELSWDAANPASFTFQPRPGRVLAGFSQLQVLYGIVAAGSQLKTLHQSQLILTAGDPNQAEQALSLALAALALNREALRSGGGFSFAAGSYQAIGTLKSLSFGSGTSTPADASFGVAMNAEIDLQVQRLLGDDEGRPIAQILTPGRPDLGSGGRRVDLDPIVQS